MSTPIFLNLDCPLCEETLRRTVATPPTFEERAICETCQVVWLIEVSTDLERVTFFDESGLIQPESISFQAL